jgi:hypothetical protein
MSKPTLSTIPQDPAIHQSGGRGAVSTPVHLHGPRAGGSERGSRRRNGERAKESWRAYDHATGGSAPSSSRRAPFPPPATAGPPRRWALPCPLDHALLELAGGASYTRGSPDRLIVLGWDEAGGHFMGISCQGGAAGGLVSGSVRIRIWEPIRSTRRPAKLAPCLAAAVPVSCPHASQRFRTGPLGPRARPRAPSRPR